MLDMLDDNQKRYRYEMLLLQKIIIVTQSRNPQEGHFLDPPFYLMNYRHHQYYLSP